MYSILLSQLDKINQKVLEKLREYIKEDANVVIIPWAFKEELDLVKFETYYFRMNEKGYVRYERNLDFLLEIGIKEENVTVLNCYKDAKEYIANKIYESDVLLLPGGNPEMFFKKVVYDTAILNVIKGYDKILIGESAGALLQFQRYFITKENNYHNHLAYYEGFGIIDDAFYIDVHTKDDAEYIGVLNEIARKNHKDIYAVSDEGALIFNRKNKKIEYFRNVSKITY